MFHHSFSFSLIPKFLPKMIFVASRRSLSTSPMPPPLPRHQPPSVVVPKFSSTTRRVPAWCNMTSDERQEHKKQLEELRLREHMKDEERQRRRRRDPGKQLLLTSSCGPLSSHAPAAPRVIVFECEGEEKKSIQQLIGGGSHHHNNSLVLNQMPTRLDIVGNLKFSSSTDDGAMEEESGDVTACFVLPSPSSFSKLTILDTQQDEEECEFLGLVLLD
ncbi:hypothetical protein B9Z55_003882 [Caenorhabditis nigoni]|uniref:Uncharacterized protein n=1 Tax=Caenorhabditis nigoni TaxID=1611254 RepID=A0A2G5VSF8_9PELO|nr:hypothetical protein B9Z55_003882 [Caenorhabditis nigoni]